MLCPALYPLSPRMPHTRIAHEQVVVPIGVFDRAPFHEFPGRVYIVMDDLETFHRDSVVSALTKIVDTHVAAWKRVRASAVGTLVLELHTPLIVGKPDREESDEQDWRSTYAWVETLLEQFVKDEGPRIAPIKLQTRTLPAHGWLLATMDMGNPGAGLRVTPLGLDNRLSDLLVHSRIDPGHALAKAKRSLFRRAVYHPGISAVSVHSGPAFKDTSVPGSPLEASPVKQEESSVLTVYYDPIAHTSVCGPGSLSHLVPKEGRTGGVWIWYDNGMMYLLFVGLDGSAFILGPVHGVIPTLALPGGVEKRSLRLKTGIIHRRSTRDKMALRSGLVTPPNIFSDA